MLPACWTSVWSAGASALARARRAAPLWLEGDNPGTITDDAYEALTNLGTAGGELQQGTAVYRPAAAHIEAGGQQRAVLLCDGSDDYINLSVAPAWRSGATRLSLSGVARWDTVAAGRILIDDDDGDMQVKYNFGGQFRVYFAAGQYGYFTTPPADELFEWRVEYDGSGATDADKLRLWINEVEQSWTGFIGAAVPSALTSGKTLLSIGRQAGVGSGYHKGALGAVVEIDGASAGLGAAVGPYLLGKYINPNPFMTLNPTLYLDSRYGRQESAGDLYGWYDSSGFNADAAQSVPAEQPTVNADGTINFAGVDENLDVAGTTLGATTTIALLLKCGASGPAGGQVLRTLAGPRFICRVGGIDRLTWYAGATHHDIDLTTAHYSWCYVVLLQDDAGNTVIRFNGAQVYSAVALATLGGTTVAALGGDGTSSNAECDLALVCVYPTVLAGADLTALEAALAARVAELTP